jgi:hypothetical protein
MKTVSKSPRLPPTTRFLSPFRRQTQLPSQSEYRRGDAQASSARGEFETGKVMNIESEKKEKLKGKKGRVGSERGDGTAHSLHTQRTRKGHRIWR